MDKKIATFLELIRLPGMFTAQADILAGFLITGAGTGKISALVWLLLASSCFYSAGMALNDFFDAPSDRIHRPDRPIPSGRVTRQAACLLGIMLLAAGAAFARMAGVLPFCVSLALVSAILLYDGVFKSQGISGPLFMSACRYFNFLMALSVQPFDGWLLIPLIPMIYIYGVTVLGRKEAQGGKAPVHTGVCALALGLSCAWAFFLYLKGVLPVFGMVPVLICFAVFLSSRVLGLLETHGPQDYQRVMKRLLISLIFLDFIIASGRAPLCLSALILLLYIPAVFSVRLFKVT